MATAEAEREVAARVHPVAVYPVAVRAAAGGAAMEAAAGATAERVRVKG